MIYIIHFHEKLAHAQHYVGYCKEDRLDARVLQHGTGAGAKTMQAVVQKGIDYEVVATYPGTRQDERRIKNYKKTSRFCPICNTKLARQEIKLFKKLPWQ